MTLFLISVALALGLSAICSLLEAVLLSTTPSQIADLSQRHPRAAVIWRGFKAQIEKPIAVILVINTAAHTIGAAIAGAQFEKLYGPQWLIAFSLVLTFLMLQFTEILPKTLGVTYNRRLAPLVATPLLGLIKLLSPVLKLVHYINRPFERRTSETPTNPLSEIAALLAMAQTSDSIDPRQAKILNAAHRLPSLRVDQIMTPRPKIVSIDLADDARQILNVVQHSPYTRLPVCDGNLDHVVGMIHVRDLFNHLRLVPGRLAVQNDPANPTALATLAENTPGAALHVIGSGEINLRKILRQHLVVPETLPVWQLLQRFQESRIHLALIVDEHGATQGLVTLEDVIEELVGEIHDEFDRPTIEMRRVPDGRIVVDGGAQLHELLPAIGVALEQETEVNTLSGYFMQQLGRMPERGDKVRLGHYEARVISIQRRRVREAELTPIAPNPGDSNN